MANLAPGTVISLTPDFAAQIEMEVDMQQWAGRVVMTEKGEFPEDPDLVLAIGDGVFLDQIQGDLLTRVMDSDGPVALMMLPSDSVHPIEARDTLTEARAALFHYRQRIDVYEETESEAGVATFVEEPIYYLLWNFFLSDAYFGLTPEAQALSQLAVMEVNHYMRFYFETKPHEWTPEDLKAVCYLYLPEKALAPDGFFAHLPAILAAFLQAMPDELKMDSVRKARILDDLAQYAPELAVHAANPDNWGPNKRLVNAMEERGLDPEDETEMERFFEQHGEELGINPEDVLAEMANHPDVSAEDQLGMLGDLLGMEDMFDFEFEDEGDEEGAEK